jgi:hypothetical protein
MYILLGTWLSVEDCYGSVNLDDAVMTCVIKQNKHSEEGDETLFEKISTHVMKGNTLLLCG